MMKQQAGFSLIELVATIVLMGIMAATVSVFIAGPIFAYVEVANRADLVSLANQSLSVMQRDVKASVPNSIRIHGGTTLELMHAKMAIAYKEGAPGSPDGLSLDTGFEGVGGEQYFRVIGTFPEEYYGDHPDWSALIYHRPRYTDSDFNKPEAGKNVYGARRAWSSTIIENGQPQTALHYGHVLSSPGLNVVRGDQGFLLGLANEDWQPDASQDIIGLRVPHSFVEHSPNHLVYFVDGPVTYHCDLPSGKLIKYWGYQLQEEQPQPNYSSRRPTGGRSAVVANKVSNCQFSFESNGLDMTLVNLNLELTSQRGETISLLQQVHVRNDP